MVQSEINFTGGNYRVEKLSPQQKKLLALFAGGGWVSNSQIVHQTRILKYTGRISELRQKGYNIVCVEKHKSGLSYYRLEA